MLQFQMTQIHRKLFLFLSLYTFIQANIFTITDTKGKVIHKQKLYHSSNAYLTQKETDYSLQAIYDELKYAEKHARQAHIIHKKAQEITQAQQRAKQLGKIYRLSSIEKQTLIQDAKYFKGGKYVWGGTSPDGFDCSGYVQYLYRKHHIILPRTALAQSNMGQEVRLNELQKGDLLFFLTDKSRGIPITHVGIYLGNGEFIHAASKKKGIIISPLFSGHYADTFVSARRVINPLS